MGVSTDALLFYGFQIPGGAEDGEDPFWGDADDPEDFIAARAGFETPEVWSVRHSERQQQILTRIGVEVVQHCSVDYPMYAIGVTASLRTARRGYPIELVSDDLEVRPEWKKLLVDFAKLVGIKAQTPKWILASNWG